MGRPNVGKSRFFNKMVGRPAALVGAAPGITLDWLEETITVAPDCRVRLIDTGGMHGEEDGWTALAMRQAAAAVRLADVLLMMVDARTGWRSGDSELLSWLRREYPSRRRLLLVNKAEGLTEALSCGDFYQLQEDLLPVSALRGSGLAAVKQRLAHWAGNEAALPQDDGVVSDTADRTILPLAIVGRPNVGKSTLLNNFLSTERAVVTPVPGTTRDNIYAPFSSRHGVFCFIDTAGMRRRRAQEEREKLSVAAARQAMQQARVVFLVADLSVGATHQDKRIASLAAVAGCAAVVVGNKSDLLSRAQRTAALRRLVEELPLGFSAPSFAVSALGTLPAGAMLRAAAKAVQCAGKNFSTAALNRALAVAVRQNPPPRVGGIRPKLRYAHQGGKEPLRVVIHGGGVRRVADDYRRYLATAMARQLAVTGVPLRVELRSEDNPYATS